MPAKRRGKAVTIPSSPAYTFGSSRTIRSLAGLAPGLCVGAWASAPIQACHGGTSDQPFQSLLPRFVEATGPPHVAVPPGQPSFVAMNPSISYRRQCPSDQTPGPGAYNIHGGLEIVESRKHGLHRHQQRGAGRRAQTANVLQMRQRFVLLQDASRLPQTGMRSSPGFPIASRPGPTGVLDKSPGPAAYNASKVLTNHRSPAYTFRGVDQKTHSSEYPGPGEYKWPEALGRTRPANPPLAIKFRFKVPADVERRPAPNAYDPTDPLKMYQGQYAKVTIKQRRRALLLDAMPDPGPQDYSPGRYNPYKPAFSMRLKLANQLAINTNPGPGHYDVAESTLGNWAAGMEANEPLREDPFLAERVETFARGAEHVTDRRFLKSRAQRLAALRTDGGGAAGPGSAQQPGQAEAVEGGCAPAKAPVSHLLYTIDL